MSEKNCKECIFSIFREETGLMCIKSNVVQTLDGEIPVPDEGKCPWGFWAEPKRS